MPKNERKKPSQKAVDRIHAAAREIAGVWNGVDPDGARADVLGSYTGTPKDRTEIIEEARLRMQVYSEFVPKLMDEDEIRQTVTAVLAELEIEQPTAKDKGRIMKTLMPRVKGKADGALVNKVLTGFFN